MTTPIAGYSTPVGAAAQAAQAAAAAKNSESAQGKAELDKDAFLKLLVAQLKYQDPLNPADPGDFMAQTAQFTQVEKLDQIAQQGESTNRALGLSAASGLLGRNVSWIDTDGTTATGKVTAAVSSIDGVNVQIGDKKISLDAITGIS